MALTPLVCRDLIPRLKPGQRIASLGYPDIVAPEREVDAWLGRRVIQYRDDSEKICKWHGIRPAHRIPDARSFFEAFECHLDVFDIMQARGDEILCDLNVPMAPTRGYDYVLDVGTLEHCFNIGQAAQNAAGLLLQDGIIYHSNPFVMSNHGFYSLNPTWFADFYAQPGFELLWLKIAMKGADEYINVPLTQRFLHGTDQELNIFAAARRTEIKQISTSIIQTKYAKLTQGE